MPARIYARYSTDRQTESSITDQLRVCREYAARHGLEVAAEYVDEGISGAALGNRPGVNRALAELAAGDVLLVVDLTRLSRSNGDLSKMIDRLVARGVTVVGVQDGYDSSRKGHKLQAGVSGIIGEAFREMIGERTYTALETRARAGRATGGRAYGFDNAGQPREPEAAIAREIFQRYADGESARAIAAELNARGVPSPGATWNRTEGGRHARWVVSALHEILTNERYVGRVVWNRSRWVKDPDTGRRQRRERPREEWIVTEGPALVDAGTWAAVRARLAERERFGGRRGGLPRYLLSGLLTCQECGSRLVVVGGRGQRYACSLHHHGGASACRMDLTVRRDVAEDVVLDPVRTFALSDEAVTFVLDEMQRLARQERSQTAQEPLGEAQALADQLARLEAAVASGALLRSDVAAQVASLHDRLGAVKRSAWRAASARPAFDLARARAAYQATVQRMRALLEGASAPARQLLHEMVGDVPVWPEAGRQYLLAQVGISTVPLIRAAGLEAVDGLVAGACFPTRLPPLLLELRRAA